jgi:hypothetical protein
MREPTRVETYIVSHRDGLPHDSKEMAGLWYHLWKYQLWPYVQLKPGDRLFWYDPGEMSIRWSSRVVEVDQFEYESKREVRERLEERFGDTPDHKYYRKGPSRGYCLAFRVDSLTLCSHFKPFDDRIPQLGWLRRSDRLGAAWIDAIESQEKLDNEVETAAEESEFDSADASDERARSLRSIADRRGQRDFRKSLLDAYGFRCAATGCDATDALEACHIVPYLGEKSNSIANGLLLRCDIHTLFDLGLIGVEPKTLKLCLAVSLRNTTYGRLNGKKVRLPKRNADRPAYKGLERRWLAFVNEHGNV